MFGKHHSEEAKAKMRAKATGRRASEETRAKLRKMRAGSGNAMFGRHHSEETKAKIRAKRFLGDKAKPQSGRARAEKMYPCPKGMERHHIDGNPLNNAPENIKIETRKEHMEADGRINGTRTLTDAPRNPINGQLLEYKPKKRSRKGERNECYYTCSG